MIRNYDMWHNYPNSYYAKAKVKRNKSIFYLFEFFPNLSWSCEHLQTRAVIYRRPTYYQGFFPVIHVSEMLNSIWLAPPLLNFAGKLNADRFLPRN